MLRVERSGCSQSCSKSGSWPLSQTVATEGGKGNSLCREWGTAQGHLAYLVLTGECHPCQEGLSPLGQKQLFASSPLFLSSSLLVSCPCGEGSCLFFFRHPPPLLYPDPTINAKGAPGTWGGSWPPLPKSSACPMWPHYGLAGLVPPWGLLLDGLTHSWSYRYLPEQGIVAPEYCKCHSQRRTTDRGLSYP